MPKRPKRKRRHPLYPEPGAWVLERYDGLPKLEPPEPLPREGRIAAHVVRDQYIAYEGLGYCVYEFIPANRIADPKLALLWSKAKRALRDVVVCLETVPEPRRDKRVVVLSKKSKRVGAGAALIGEPVD